MGNVKIKPEEFEKTLKKELDEFAKATGETVKEAVIKTADAAVKELKSTSPKKTGRYAKSWKKKVTRENSAGEEATVYAGRYQLTHLLENGHAKRGGGRVEGIPHIAPAEEHASERLEKEIKEGLNRG